MEADKMGQVRNALPSLFSRWPQGQERSSTLDEANAGYSRGGFSRICHGKLIKNRNQVNQVNQANHG